MRMHARENGVHAVSAAKCGRDRVGVRAVCNDSQTLAVGPDGAVAGGLMQTDGPGFVPLATDRRALARARARFSGFDQARPITPGTNLKGKRP